MKIRNRYRDGKSCFLRHSNIPSAAATLALSDPTTPWMGIRSR